MKIRLLTLLPFVAAIGIGCSPDAKSKETSPSSPAVSTGLDAPANSATSEPSSPSSAPTTAASSADVKPTPTPPPTTAVVPKTSGKPVTSATSKPAQIASTSKPGSNVIPFDVKHDGYAYSGVSNTKPVDMELTMSTEPGKILTGAQTVTLQKVKDGKAIYSVDRSGQLAKLGSEEWTISKDGVFTTKSSMMDVGDKAMELPANPKPGMTWTVHTKSSQPTASMDMVMTFKIIGLQDVSTKGGKFKDALMVEQDGVGTLQNQKVRTESQNWYVKGIGLVKATMKNHLSSGTTESLEIQETKN